MDEDAIKQFNEFQGAGVVHPLTCGNNRTDEAHTAYQAEHGGDFGQLVATPEGILCPVCGWKQPSNSPIVSLVTSVEMSRMLQWRPFGPESETAEEDKK